MPLAAERALGKEFQGPLIVRCSAAAIILTSNSLCGALESCTMQSLDTQSAVVAAGVVDRIIRAALLLNA